MASKIKEQVFVRIEDESLLSISPFSILLDGYKCILETELEKMIPLLTDENKDKRIRRYVRDDTLRKIDGISVRKILIIPENFTTTRIQNYGYYYYVIPFVVNNPNIWFNLIESRENIIQQATNIYLDNQAPYKDEYGCNILGFQENVFLISYEEYTKKEEEKNKQLILDIINNYNNNLKKDIENLYNTIEQTEKKIMENYTIIHRKKKLLAKQTTSIDLPINAKIEECCIILNTNNIIIHFAGKKIYLGKFCIKYNLKEKEIKIQNTEFLVNGYAHPHIASYICWGSFREKITEAIEENNFKQMFAITIAFLSEHNDDSTFVKALLFPQINENGKLTNLGNTEFKNNKKGEDYAFDN